MKNLLILAALLSSAGAQVPSTVTQGAAGPKVPNDTTTGTTCGSLVKYVAGTGAAIKTSTSDTSGIMGVANANGETSCGTFGSVTVADTGIVQVAFDGTPTAGDYVINSTTTAGFAHDNGTTAPTATQCLGRVANPATSFGGFYNVVWGKCGSTGGAGSSPAQATTLTTPGIANSDGQGSVIVNGVLYAGSSSVFDAGILQRYVTASAPTCNGYLSGYDCAIGLGNAYRTATGFTPTIHVPAGAWAQNIPLTTPATGAGWIVDCDPGSRIYANTNLGATSGNPVSMWGIAAGSGTTAQVEQRGTCYFDGNHLATGGVNWNNALNPKTENLFVNYIDYTPGNGNGYSNVTFSCLGCSNAKLHNANPAAGNTGHNGFNVTPYFPTDGAGHLQTTAVIGKIAESFASSGGTGGVVGTYTVTSSAGSDTCNNYPTFRISVPTSGGGYAATGSVLYHGFMCTGNNLNYTVAGSPGVTGNTFSAVLDTGGGGYGCTKDSDGVISPITPMFVSSSQPITATLPATYAAGTTMAGTLVNPMNVTTTPCVFSGGNYVSGGQITGATLADSTVASTGANLVGSGMYVFMNTYNPLYVVSQFSMTDSEESNVYATGGQRGIDLPGGGSTYYLLHSQSPYGIIDRGGNNIIDPEPDSNQIVGILTTNSASVVRGGLFPYNTAGAYPGVVTYATTTNNSSNNGQYRGMRCGGLPEDLADYTFFSSALGSAVSAGGFTVGTTIDDVIHCTNEPNLTTEIALERATKFTELGVSGTQYSPAYFANKNIVGGVTPFNGIPVYSTTAAPTFLTLTNTGTSGAATLIGSTLNIPNYSSTTGGVFTANAIQYATSTTASRAAMATDVSSLYSVTQGSGSLALFADGTQHAVSAVGTVAGQIPVYPGTGNVYVPASVSGDCTMNGTGVITCIPSVVALSGTTPAITAGHTVFYSLTLTGNTSPTITGVAAGDNLYFHICQGATAYTFTWPNAFKSPSAIDFNANKCSNQEFISLDGTSLTPVSIGVSEVTP